MKTPKPNAKQDKASCDKSDLPDEMPANLHALGLPSVAELAMIAATLSPKVDGYPDDWPDEELVRAARRLWLSARKILFDSVRIPVVALEDARNKEEESIRKLERERFPFILDEKVTREVFLRIMLPQFKNRSADLARIGKAFVRDRLRVTQKKEPTADEITGAYGAWKNVGDAISANETARVFEEWYPQYVKGARRSAGLKSAAIKSKTRPVNL